MSEKEKKRLLIGNVKEVNGDVIKEEKSAKCDLKARHIFMIMGFMAHFNLYVLRNSINVAIVAMVNSTNEESVSDDNATSYECPDRGESVTTKPANIGVFEWDTIQQGLLLGCYYYGYIVSNVPGAWLARRFGVRVVIGVAHVVGAIITLFIPLVAWTSFELLVTLRVILGLFQGVVCASYSGGVGLWSPPLERSTMFSVGLCGSSMGTVIVFPITGLIADNLGWEAVFYITGGFVLAWTLLWFYLIHDSPETHPRISRQERTYILESLGTDHPNIEKEKTPVTVPWKEMLTSPYVYAIILPHFASNWGNYTLMSMLPTYMATVLNFDLSASGFLSSVPYICQLVVTIGAAILTDWVLEKGYIRVVWMRKINTILGLGVPALFVILAGYIGCNATLAVVFFSISTGFTGFTVPGSKANPIDIAPRYSGLVYAISNTIANISGFAAPQAVGVLLASGNTLTTWQTVFWISAGVYVAGAIIFAIMGTGTEQSWAKENYKMPEKSTINENFQQEEDWSTEKSRL